MENSGVACSTSRHEKMNSEEAALDLCNAKNSAGESTASTATDEIIPRSSGLLMDGDAGKQGVDVPTLARLTACPDGDIEPQRTKDKSDSEELNGNKNNGITVTAAAVGFDPVDCSNDSKKHPNSADMLPETPVSSFSIGDGVDEGDMDIGVDLSLDETGVLESEPPVPKLESASSGTGVNSISRSDTESSEKSSEPGQQDSPLSPSQTETLSSTTSDQDEGQKHKPGAKRVTFPSDDDIVSGAVEPKDPWRHGKIYCFISLIWFLTDSQIHTHYKTQE